MINTISALKSISWRCVATLTTRIISWIITHQVKTALSIASIEFVLKIFIYYGHERIWAALQAWTQSSITHKNTSSDVS